MVGKRSFCDINLVEMSLHLTRKLTDRSDNDRFLFSFFCDRCGFEWTSQSVSFLEGGFTAIEHEEARLLIWAYEHKVAFEHANLDARTKFNRCLNCGRWVCNKCYEIDDGLCRDCAKGF